MTEFSSDAALILVRTRGCLLVAAILREISEAASTTARKGEEIMVFKYQEIDYLEEPKERKLSL